MKLIVNANKCPQNHKCPSVAKCPEEAISQADTNSLPVIDGKKCISCGICVKFCPKGVFEKV